MDDKEHELRVRADVARERVIKQALLCASEMFCVGYEDPGWQAEANEEWLDQACMEFIAAKAAVADHVLNRVNNG